MMATVRWQGGSLIAENGKTPVCASDASDPANWSGGALPVNGDDVVFSATPVTFHGLTALADATLNTVTFEG